MDVRLEILFIILGCSVVTLFPRVLPLMVLSRVVLPDWALRWLSYIPITAMSALLAQELFLSDGILSLWNVKVMAAMPAFAVAIFTRSLLGTVITGVVTIMILRNIGNWSIT